MQEERRRGKVVEEEIEIKEIYKYIYIYIGWLESYCHLVCVDINRRCPWCWPCIQKHVWLLVLWEPSVYSGYIKVVCRLSSYSTETAAVQAKGQSLWFQAKHIRLVYLQNSRLGHKLSHVHMEYQPPSYRQLSPCRLSLIDCRANSSLVQYNC